MAKTKRKTSAKTTHAAPATALHFPSVTTRLPSLRSTTHYDNEGVPFTDPTGDCTMDLESFFGPAAIGRVEGSGKIIFHLMGDSGVGTAEQEAVADAMARDIDDANHEAGPSFMVHLGDIMYGPNKLAHYADRFYRKYDQYNRLIFAIPGNHDGEKFPSTDPNTLDAFKTNFCAPKNSQPPLGKQFGVLMPNQPGPYWHLQAPFVDIIGLYSNAAEDVGIISNSKVGTKKQKSWLLSRLKAIAAARTNKKRKALLIAVHHPPYARGFQAGAAGHPGSPEMLQDIDDCCLGAGILPDAVLAGHTHSYQHYVRTQSLNGTTCTVPYLIIGTGGIALQRIPAPTGVRNAAGDVQYFSAFKDYGYVTATVSATQVLLEFTAIIATHRELRERVTVDLATHKIV